MVLGWRKRKSKSRDHGGKPHMEIVTPNHFSCPISLDLMKDPVTLSTGITYDRESIERWFEEGHCTCPVTSQIILNFDRIPNHTLRIMIQQWCVQNQQYGVERIPTPRIPVSSVEVTEVLERVKASARRVHQYRCLELVHKIERMAAESERNKRCIVENGAAGVLAAAFHAFAADSVERNENVLEEILSALNWMFPLDIEARKSLGSDMSLRCMVRFLNHRDVSMKQKSIVALKEVLGDGDQQQHVETLEEIDGINEILAKFIRKRICPTITKASLDVVYYMASSDSPATEKIKLEFIKLDLVSSLVEILVDTEKSLCERALGVLDSLCSCKEGRQKAYANALTIPVLVKKILRVSELATEFSVSAIWKLVKNGGNASESTVLVESLQVGAFQKLLLILQVDCGCEKKEKITELLKLLNPCRAELDCIDSVDFKIKRSF